MSAVKFIRSDVLCKNFFTLIFIIFTALIHYSSANTESQFLLQPGLITRDLWTFAGGKDQTAEAADTQSVLFKVTPDNRNCGVMASFPSENWEKYNLIGIEINPLNRDMLPADFQIAFYEPQKWYFPAFKDSIGKLSKGNSTVFIYDITSVKRDSLQKLRVYYNYANRFSGQEIIFKIGKIYLEKPLEPLPETILKGLTHKEMQVRADTILSLGEKREFINESIPYLIQIITDFTKFDFQTENRHAFAQEEKIRACALAVLAGYGPAADNAFTRLLLWPDTGVRLSAASALYGKGQYNPVFNELIEWASPPYASEGPSLHPNSGFEAETLLGWKIHLKDGAEGEGVIDRTRSRTGRQSLQITKKNGRGYIMLQSSQPVYLPDTGNTLTYRMYFQSKGASVSSLLIPCFEDSQGNLFYNNESGRHSGFSRQSQSSLRDTPEGFWDKRILTLNPRVNAKRQTSPPLEKVFLTILVYGNPVRVWLDDVTFPSDNWNMQVSAPVFAQPLFNKKTALEIISTRPDAACTVQTIDGIPQILLNGQIVPPVFNHSWQSKHSDYALFEKNNIAMHTVVLHFNDYEGRTESGKVNWPGAKPVWPGASKKNYDFSYPMALIEDFALKAPNSYIVLGFNIGWPADYVTRNPDTEWVNEKGEKGYGNYGWFAGFTSKPLEKDMFYWPSPYSKKAINDAADVIREFMKIFRKSPFSKMLIGAFVAGGHDGQFMIHHNGHGEIDVAYFQEWLKSKYKSDQALANAWNKQGITFSSAEVPKKQEVSARPGTSSAFYDPVEYAANADYSEFRGRQMWVIKDTLLKAAKEGAGKNIIGMAWNMGGGLIENITHIFNTDALDIFITQPLYHLRIPGHVSDWAGGYNSLRHKKKMMLKEMDTRSFFREAYKQEMTVMKMGTPMDMGMFRATYMKEIGQVIAHHQGYWYYDISENAFRHPQIMAEINFHEKVFNIVRAAKDNFIPDVAFVYSDSSVNYCRQTIWGFRSYAFFVLETLEQALLASGVPASRYFIEDALHNPDFLKHKVYIFVNTYHLTGAQRTFINLLKKNGNTLVWHYAPGYIGEKNLSEKNISELTGMKVSTVLSPVRQLVFAEKTSDPLAKGLPENNGVGDSLRFSHLEISSVESFLDTQRFAIEDPSAVNLAKYDDGTVATAVKRFPGWTSVYSAAVGGFSPELVHNIAEQSGAYYVSGPHTWAEVNNNFLSIHGLQNRKKETVFLPRQCSVIDPRTDTILYKNIKSFQLDIQAQESYWFLLK